MRRRELILGLGGVLAATRAAHTQTPKRPVIGFLRSTAAAPFGHLAVAFRAGLKEQGLIDGENVSILYRYADGHVERLPALAGELLRSEAAVIIGNSQAAEAAKRLTATIPIVFVTSDDPVQRGLVASLARPAGNATGFTFFGGGKLTAKRMEILHELLPTAAVFGLLMDPNWPGSRADLSDAEATARALGLRLVVAKAVGETAFAAAFAAIRQADARGLLVAGAPSFSSKRAGLIELSARHSLPAVYDLRDYVIEGGLMSYAGSFTEAYRQAGVYAGRILKGYNPAELPVQQPTKIEFVLNLKTAKALGLTVPQAILARADEVIE